MIRFSLTLTALLISQTLLSQLRLPAVFADHMVLQQKSEAPIWGWSWPGSEVTVTPGWSGESVKTKASNTGYWMVTLRTPEAGGPWSVTIKGNEELVLSDVMIGEVWICSGQSNMEWSMNNTNDGKEEVPHASRPNIRLFQPKRMATDFPQVKGEGSWNVCTPESAQAFSAVAYFFGKKLHENLKVPIGLVNVSWGGTPAEVWMPAERVSGDPSLVKANEQLREDGRWPKKPGVVYNAMIHPLVPMAIAGAIWYQGEGNTGAPLQYKAMMTQLIASWRSAFKKDFPFYYVQIAPFSGYGEVETGTLIREQQVRLLEVPKTGMVIISDHVEDVTDIHPKFKRPVGERLANYALADHYQVLGIVYQSPTYKSMAIEKSRVRINFDHADNGLVSKGGPPTEFQIAGADGRFVPATARIEGNTVIVWSKEIKQPVAVRFGWPNGSVPNLFSKEGLPVSCFRTDDWPILK